MPGNNEAMSLSPSSRGRFGRKSMKGLSVSVPSRPWKAPGAVMLFGPEENAVNEGLGVGMVHIVGCDVAYQALVFGVSG